MLFAAPPAFAELGRDDQWIYIPAEANRGAIAELRGDSIEGPATDLIFQIECVATDRSLRFLYDDEFLDLLPSTERQAPIALILNEGAIVYTMPTERTSGHLEGRLALSERFMGELLDAADVQIFAPSDMGESFHGGDAPALRRVASECWTPSDR